MSSIDEILTRLYRRFKEWSKRGFGPDDVTWCEVKADVLEMIRGAAPPDSYRQGAKEMHRRCVHTALHCAGTDGRRVAAAINALPLPGDKEG